MPLPTANKRDIRCGWLRLRSVSSPPYVPGDENSLKTRRLGRRDGKLELIAAAFNSKESYRKQNTLQEVTLSSIRNNEVLF